MKSTKRTSQLNYCLKVNKGISNSYDENRRINRCLGIERFIKLLKNNQYILKKELATRFRVSTSTVERWASKNIIPKPIRLGPNRIVWDIDEIKRWENSLK